MQVILKEDSVKLGNKGDLVSVADGYARNFLIPKGFAIMATSSSIRHNERTQKSMQKKLIKEQEKMKEIAEKISQTELVLKAKAGDDGKLFGSITNAEIVLALKEAIDVEIDKRRVGLHQPIRNVGKYTLPIKVYSGVDAEISLIVIDKDEKAKAKKRSIEEGSEKRFKNQRAKRNNIEKAEKSNLEEEVETKEETISEA